MKTFDQFLIERSMNGDIYMTIGQAFLSLDRALRFAQDNDMDKVNQIVNQQLDQLNRTQSAYAQNMNPQSANRLGYRAEDATRQLGEIFSKFYGYFSNLRKQLQNPSANFVNMLSQAKNDLANDYKNAVSLITA